MTFDVRTFMRVRLIEAAEKRALLLPFTLVLALFTLGNVLDAESLRKALALTTLAIASVWAFRLESPWRLLLFAVADAGYFFVFRNAGTSLLFVFLGRASVYAFPPLALHVLTTLHSARHRLISSLQPLHLYGPMTLLSGAVLVVLYRQNRAGVELTGFESHLVVLVYWAYYGILLFFILLGSIADMGRAPATDVLPRSTHAGDFESEGRFTIAGRLYAEEKRFDKGAEMAQRAGDWASAAERYRQAGDVYNAAEMYFRTGKLEEALEMYEAARSYAAAADVAFRLGKVERAAELFAKGGDTVRAVNVLEEAGRLPQAELYAKAGLAEKAAAAFEARGDLLPAAEILELELGRKEAAAALYDSAGLAGKAGGLYAAAGKTREAIAAYLKSPDTHFEAARLSFETGDLTRARTILETRSPQTDEALMMLAQIYWQDHRIDDGIRTLQTLKTRGEATGAAHLLLGRCFMAKALPELAEGELRAATQMQLPAPQDLEARYHLARVLEVLRNDAEAAEIYQRIIGQDFHYKDAELRYRALKEKAAPRA